MNLSDTTAQTTITGGRKNLTETRTEIPGMDAVNLRVGVIFKDSFLVHKH